MQTVNTLYISIGFHKKLCIISKKTIVILPFKKGCLIETKKIRFRCIGYYRNHKLERSGMGF